MRVKLLRELFSAVFLAVVSFATGYMTGQSPFAPVQVFPNPNMPREAEQVFRPFWEVWNLVHEEYVDQPVDDVALTEGAIEGMLATLDDPNTRYLSPEDEARARESMSGEFQGIGAEIERVGDDIVVVSPIEGSPAEAAGLRPGDILRQADGIDLTGMDIFEAAEIVRGPAGTAVTLLIERDNQQLEITIIRDVIKVPSVRGEMLADNIAYIRLTRFGDNTAQELETLLTDLIAQNPQGLILDLRRNPGGSLNTAIEVADQFLPETTVLIERFGDGSEEIYRSTEAGLAEDIPMIVLIDEGSASASEVIAGALRDEQRAVLIGQTSFGKGTVQTWRRLSNGGGVRITIARWLTPAGRWVHGQGLEPDIVVPLPEETSSSEMPEDTQLQTAINYLLGRPLPTTEPSQP